MAMQHLIVEYDRSRKVYIDGDWGGWTNEQLELEAGRHDVDLGEPPNVEPGRYTIDLYETSVNDPMVISFVRKS